jgi:hypothetical protein
MEQSSQKERKERNPSSQGNYNVILVLHAKPKGRSPFDILKHLKESNSHTPN